MPECILIADDEPQIRMGATISLRKAGFDTRVAADGEEALAIILGAPAVDLLVLDLKMPGISGIELLDELQKRNIHIPVLVVTGYADSSSLHKLFERGCMDFLEKPVDPKEFIGLTMELIERYHNQGVVLHHANKGDA